MHYFRLDVAVLVNQMRYEAIDEEVKKFAEKWYLSFEDVKYEALNFKHGELTNASKLKESANYQAYKEHATKALPKFKFYATMIQDFKENLMPEINSLLCEV